ncbi:hypothetical protein Q5P01_015038 [Channa striata]|uniref:Ig-like domain-containing protein n=1 Tax=Channa striata TaxID=64152 RepID=A0AA88MGK1_CHASR|nr:hypothetical protein Q5P01_015038 [Channa striata]
MLLMLLSLLCCVPAGKACLQCDSTIRFLHEELALSAPTVAEQIEVKNIVDHAFVTYKETSLKRKGIIDPTTLYRASTEYQNEFDRFMKMDHVESLTFEAIQIVEKGRNILEKHLDIFIREGLCPNKCGDLNQRVMDCISCRYKINNCPSPTGQQDCGEYPVEAEEEGQVVLMCFLPWHSLLLGHPAYHYSWVQGVPGTKKLNKSDFNTLVVTDDSYVILNQLHVDEQGTYLCSLEENGTVFYQVTFLLTVKPLPVETQRPHVTLPTPPHGDKDSAFQTTEGLLVLAIAVITALSLAASVGLTVVLGIMMNQWRAAKEPRKSGKWEQTTQNML